ncbi:hypothetical protein TNCV_1375771 [Trichonephila clavipes]|nr:hypothetical protein TNCV_1375771 [Trichonephila clavipes]
MTNDNAPRCECKERMKAFYCVCHGNRVMTTIFDNCREKRVSAQVLSSSFDHGSKLRGPSPKAIEKLEQCDVKIHSHNLAVGKSWSRLLDGQRRVQLSALPELEVMSCFRVITGHDYLQTHPFKIGLADSPLCHLCKSGPMTGEHLSDCPALLHVLSQDNCGVLFPA